MIPVVIVIQMHLTYSKVGKTGSFTKSSYSRTQYISIFIWILFLVLYQSFILVFNKAVDFLTLIPTYLMACVATIMVSYFLNYILN